MNSVGTLEGFKVVGPNTSDGTLHFWHFRILEQAQGFSRQLCQDTGEPVYIVRVLEAYQVSIPVERVLPKGSKA